MGALTRRWKPTLPGKPRRKPRHLEDTQQALLFRWLRVHRWQNRPLADYAWHTPNGGKRNLREAARFKLMGVKPGVPDVTLAIAMGSYHGLYIELKATESGTCTQNQLDVAAMLIAQGYRVDVCHGWREAAATINDYLGTSYDS